MMILDTGTSGGRVAWWSIKEETLSSGNVGSPSSSLYLSVASGVFPR